jgi:ATP-dependent DNA helicase RecG
MLAAVDAGRQAALMVPTEVLAEQHLRTLTHLLAPLGVNVLDGLRVAGLTSSSTRTHRRRVLGELLSGDIDLVVGTHALLEEGVRFADLGSSSSMSSIASVSASVSVSKRRRRRTPSQCPMSWS